MLSGGALEPDPERPGLLATLDSLAVQDIGRTDDTRADQGQ